MFWLSQGGGPWGSGPRGGGPWGGATAATAAGRARGAAAPSRPISRSCCAAARIASDACCRRAASAAGAGSRSVALVIVGAWLASGFYRVDARRGRGGAALWRLQPDDRSPASIITCRARSRRVLKPSVTRVNRTEIGYRNAEGRAAAQATRQVPEEALMLTGDENIVDINFTVFWVIKDARAYLFNIRAPEATVKSAAESAMREVIGETPIAQAWPKGAARSRPTPIACCKGSSTSTAPGSTSPSCNC